MESTGALAEADWQVHRPAVFGTAYEIEAALDELGPERRLGTTVTEVGDGYAALSDGTEVEADAVVRSVGMRADDLTRQIRDELDHLGRTPVDRWLRVLPEVFVAGYNAAADLLGVPLRDFTPGPYVTCLDLGAAGGSSPWAGTDG
ncbi:FAD-dependent oxidoreductase [Nonomuraea sp. NPDC051191]|uniref:FAD-dependent oxidoreductase n=1 Tax=Nonomuraea sp. NPDC051191 TaxID=3364372 RepID=UPI00378AE842